MENKNLAFEQEADFGAAAATTAGVLLSVMALDVQDAASVNQTVDTIIKNQVAAVVILTIEDKEPPIRTRTSHWSEEFTALKTGPDPDGKQLQKSSPSF